MNNPKNPLLTKKARKSRVGTSLKRVNLERSEKKLLNILDRQINLLLAISKTNLFNKDEAGALVNYLKVLKQFTKDSTESIDSLTDEQLEKLASKK